MDPPADTTDQQGQDDKHDPWPVPPGCGVSLPVIVWSVLAGSRGLRAPMVGLAVHGSCQTGRRDSRSSDRHIGLETRMP